MSKFYLVLILLPINSFLIGQKTATLLHNDLVINRSDPTFFNPDWAPFFHGVASGDPLEDRVIIWTRVTPEVMNGTPIQVDWRMATDPMLTNIIYSGSVSTDPEKDYTVKIDVSGLEAGTTYYYSFSALDKNSLTGKTKTAPTGDQTQSLKFGVVSCSSFQSGYFNAYRRLAERNDLDAIIHLGDYIYEYPDGTYGDPNLISDRPIEPIAEIVSLEEYRTRYSTYRMDTNLVRVHQQHPFIAVWDDHESANGAYQDGASNHTEALEGPWSERKAASRQAFFEWLPVREQEDQKVYRALQYGHLMDLILLDTRLEGRQQQLNDATDPALQDTNRTMMGAQQKAWLLEQLANSSAKWKVIGQQVVFTKVHIGWASLINPAISYYGYESLFLDVWNGYPAERESLLRFIEDAQINNTVILSGDFHTSFAFDIPIEPTTVTLNGSPPDPIIPVYELDGSYDPDNGAGSIAVEFVTPSITSPNFDENSSLLIATLLQQQMNSELLSNGDSLGNPNPHMKYAQMINHGYLVLNVSEDSIQADWFFSPITAPASTESFGQAWYTLDGENHLLRTSQPSPPKADQDEPAPNDPPLTTHLNELPQPADPFVLLGLYPNPFRDHNTLHYSLAQTSTVQIELLNQEGKLLRELLQEQLKPGIYSLKVEGQDLPPGIYHYRIKVDNQVYSARIMRH